MPVAPGTGLVRGGRNSEIGIARAGKISSATNKKKIRRAESESYLAETKQCEGSPTVSPKTR